MMTTPARAMVTALVISRAPNAADSAANRARADSVRARIAGGESFDAVARELSDDTVTAAQGGALGPQTPGALDSTFDAAARALRPGQLSNVVPTSFGLHLIRLDSLRGDTLHARHILLRHQQTEASAVVSDRLADSVARIAGGVQTGDLLDSAAVASDLARQDLEIIEGQRAISISGIVLPGLAQWALKSGARVGEVSDLLDSEGAYFIARLDSLVPGGEPPLSRISDEIRLHLARRKAVEALEADAQAFATAAAGSSLEAAAQTRGLTLSKTEAFTRLRFVPGMGQSNAAIGAAFSLPVGAISAPVVTDDAVYVIRVDNRWDATRSVWEEQSDTQRLQLVQQLQQERYRQYLSALRAEANVSDRRVEVMAAYRAPPE
jgi:peptidyl-prolyl cis-trans isomerase D